VRLFAFSVTVELILSVAVTVFDTFPSVNCLYDQSSFHWQLPQDSSAPLAITLQLLKFSGRFHHCILAVTASQLWLLWLLSPFLHVTSGCDLGPCTRVLCDFMFSRSSVASCLESPNSRNP
jgi:hypothetical protein